MSNGTLEDHLHKLGTLLSWIQRLKICIGTARGLHYLHTGTGIEFGVIHRDVKSSNIFLHDSWAAKISDFGLSRIAPTNQQLTGVNTLVKGTFGYFDPDYYSTGRLTRKSDVYAFGVVLLEVLCRKRAVDGSLDEYQWNLARWVQESIKEGNLKNEIDPEIRGEISSKCLKEFVRITERCLLSNPKQRSTMAEVVVSLESVLTLQEKINSSLHPGDRTIFGRMVDKFPFPSNGETSEATNHTAELLSWGTRLTILIGIARGLAYLHSSKVIYRCVKTHDILLDQDFSSKLGDFGLVKSGPEIGRTHVGTLVRATVGYIDPDYVMTGHLTVKTGIYGFGMVLLETLTGLQSRYAKELLEQYGLVDWASIIRADKGELRKIMDPRLEQYYPEEGAFKCIELALRCLEGRPKDRPSIDEVLQSLEQIHALDNYMKKI